MTVISFAACTGAPGVTTMSVATSLGLMGEVDEVVLVEAAISGGVIGGQYELPTEPSLTSLSLALGADRPNLFRHAQALPGGLPVVAAPPSGLKTSTLLQARGSLLADYLHTEAAVTVVDCGRVAVGSPVVPVLEVSSLVGLVVTPSRENFRLAATTIAELQESTEGAIPAGWVIVGPCPWTNEEIAGQYGLPVLASVPSDRAGAEAIAGLRKLRRNSSLARAARSLADDLVKHLRVSRVGSPLGYLEPAPDAGPVPETDRPSEEMASEDVDDSGLTPPAESAVEDPTERPAEDPTDGNDGDGGGAGSGAEFESAAADGAAADNQDREQSGGDDRVPEPPGPFGATVR